MIRDNVSDLIAFIAVAREGSFTRAATKLGVSQPALSHTMRMLEERLGLRLLNRTTRSVAPTEAGERLLRSIEPNFAQIERSLTALTELRDKPSGIVRITSTQHAAETVLWPKLAGLMHDYPDIVIELVTDEGLTNIVSERFDAGVRVGEYVEKDMIAVRIGPEMRQALWERRDISRNGRIQNGLKISQATVASTFAASRVADISPGNSKSAGAKSMCAWKARWR